MRPIRRICKSPVEMIIGQHEFPADEWVFVQTSNLGSDTLIHRKETGHSSSPRYDYEVCCGCPTVFFKPSATRDEKKDWQATNLEQCTFKVGQHVIAQPQFSWDRPDHKANAWCDLWVATRKKHRWIPFLPRAGSAGIVRELPQYDFFPVYGVEFDCQQWIVFAVHESHLCKRSWLSRMTGSVKKGQQC